MSEEAGIHFVDCIFWWEYAYKWPLVGTIVVSLSYDSQLSLRWCLVLY